MALNLKLADAFVEIRADLSKLGPDLAKLNAMLGGLGGGGLAAAVAAGMAQGAARGSVQSRDALGRFASAGMASGVASGLGQGLAQAGGQVRSSLSAAVASGVTQGLAAGARNLPPRDAIGRFIAGGGAGGGGAGGVGPGPGFGAGFGTGALQGLGLSGFATSPAMALGSMAGGAVRGGIGLMAEGLKESVSTAMGLEATFSDLQRVTGESADNVDRFKHHLFDLAGKQAGVSFADLTGIALGGAKAGVPFEGLETFTRGIARIKNAMGEGEGLNADQLTNDTTKILTVFGLGTEKVEGFGSALVRMANLSTASGADIVQTTKTLSGTLKSLNVDVGMGLSIGSVIADVGLTNQQGANAMSQILRNMAAGSAEMAEKIGMPVEQFQRAIRTDAIGALELVIAKFKEINAVDPIKGQEFIKGLGYEGIRAAGAFQQISSAIEEMQKRAKIAREEMSSLVALTSADVLKSATSGGATGKLGNAVTELKDAVGKNFLPAVRAGSDAAAGAIRGTARAMPTIVAGGRLAAEAAAGTAGGPLVSGGLAAARGAWSWLFPESAPAIPGRSTGMAAAVAAARPAPAEGEGAGPGLARMLGFPDLDLGAGAGPGVAGWGKGAGGEEGVEQLKDVNKNLLILIAKMDEGQGPGKGGMVLRGRK